MGIMKKHGNYQIGLRVYVESGSYGRYTQINRQMDGWKDRWAGR